MIRRDQGDAAADTFHTAATSDPALVQFYLADANALANVRDGRVSSPADLIAMPATAGGSSAAAAATPVGGDLSSVVVSGDRTSGDQAAHVLVATDGYLTTLQQDNPTTFAIVKGDLALARGGPIGAVGSYGLDAGCRRGCRRPGSTK